EWDNEEFRLSLIYFAGDPGKLNIHLRSVINDILPTTASKLDKLCRQVVEEMEEIIYDQTRLSEKSAARKTRQIGNLFYLLVTAFGPSYLWSSLEKAFKKQPLAKRLFYKNCSARMTQLAKMLPESMFTLQQEAVDYFAINRFLDNYSIELVNTGDCQINSPKNPEGGDLIMKPVQELISLTWETLAEDIKFENIDELGFAAGQVVQRFGNSYYAGTNGKDYIKHRIMTFGTSLTPEVIHLKALGRMEEYTSMLDLKVSLDVLKRAAVITMGFVQYEGEIKTNKDRFMAAFWAGYSLGRKKKASELKENQESDN
ncbi:MAG TPA: hypothetical protein GXZ87_03650, partial [Bacteroidales bacterium]|nr:hypothetical protein [Bacteroidales bacterium]